MVALDSADALASWARAAPPRSSDFRHFLHISDALGLERMGRGADRFMGFGAYPREGRTRFRPGVWGGGDAPLDPGGDQRGDQPQLDASPERAPSPL
ncbi:MAG: hypothetical protein AB2807_09445 [Candidatus Sedimenticola endophacoides]